MDQHAVVVRALQDQVKVAVQTKIPVDFHEDARSLFPLLGKVIHSAVYHFKPQSPESLLSHLRGNRTHEVKLLVELLTEKDPLFFMVEVERQLFLRKKDMARRRQERRVCIEQAFSSAVKRVADRLKFVRASARTVPILDYLVKNIEVAEVGSLGQLVLMQFWQDTTHREALKQEIDRHIYYFVVRLLDALRSYDLPENFKVRGQDLDLIRMAVLVALSEVFATTVERVKTGRFILRNSHYGNRGDRSVDREMFLTRKRRKGLVGLVGDA